MLTQSFWDLSSGERQPAYATFAPSNKKSCFANKTVAVAVQAFTVRACARISQAFPTKHMGMLSYAFPSALWLFSLHCPYKSYVIKQIIIGNNTCFQILFCFIQVCCVHNVVKAER